MLSSTQTSHPYLFTSAGWRPLCFSHRQVTPTLPGTKSLTTVRISSTFLSVTQDVTGEISHGKALCVTPRSHQSAHGPLCSPGGAKRNQRVADSAQIGRKTGVSSPRADPSPRRVLRSRRKHPTNFRRARANKQKLDCTCV